MSEGPAFEQKYILDLIVKEIEGGISLALKSVDYNKDGTLTVKLQFSEELDPKSLNPIDFENLLDFEIENPPKG